MTGFEWIIPLVKPILELLGFTLPKIENKTKGILQLLGSHQNLLAYKQHIEELYSTINLIGTNKPIPIDSIFTELFILDEPTANKRNTSHLLGNFNEDELEKLLNPLNKKNGLDLIKDFIIKRLLILGSPGAGKTTFLKYITYVGSKGEFGDKVVSFKHLRKRNQVF